MPVVKSACRGCHGVCQVLVHMEGGRVVKVTGDPDSHISCGYLCPKGAAAPELLYHPDRVTYPLRRKGKRGENKWERISWDEALDEVADRMAAVKRESGSEYFAMVQGTGRPFTSFTSRFANAFGTPNFAGVAHLCYMPRWLASVHTMGQLPICDFYGFGGEMPACIVLWGANLTETGASDGMCGGMVSRALRKAKRVIIIDPRKIKPAEKADHWLQLRPGTDGALALAMINSIIADDLVDHSFIDGYTLGYDRLVEHVRPFTPEWAEPVTGVPADGIRAAARTYATTKPAAMLWGNGIDMSPCNYQTARSLLILRAITGNIDRPGGDVLWVPPVGVKQRSLFMNVEVVDLQLPPPVPVFETEPKDQPDARCWKDFQWNGADVCRTDPHYDDDGKEDGVIVYINMDADCLKDASRNLRSKEEIDFVKNLYQVTVYLHALSYYRVLDNGQRETILPDLMKTVGPLSIAIGYNQDAFRD